MTSLVNNDDNKENTEHKTNSDPQEIIRNKWKKVEQNLQKYNLNLVNCDKDGNCQFSAILNSNSTNLRACIVNELKNNKPLYEHFIDRKRYE